MSEARKDGHMKLINGKEEIVRDVLAMLNRDYEIPAAHIKGFILRAFVGDPPTIEVTIYPRLQSLTEDTDRQAVPHDLDDAIRLARAGEVTRTAGTDYRSASSGPIPKLSPSAYMDESYVYPEPVQVPLIGQTRDEQPRTPLHAVREREPHMTPHPSDFDEAMRAGCTCEWADANAGRDPIRMHLTQVAQDCPL